jgi:hypothetical protein
MKKRKPVNSLKFYKFHDNWNKVIFVVQFLIRLDEYILFSIKMYTSIQSLYLRFMQNYSTSTIRIWSFS